MKHLPTSQLIGQLMDRDPELRVEAANALAERGIPTTGAVLMLALDDKEPEVREAVATALAAVKGPGARRALERAEGDADPKVAAAVRAALDALDRAESAPDEQCVRAGDYPGRGFEDAQPGRPTPHEELGQHWDRVRDHEPAVRAAALSALARSNDPSVSTVLVESLEDKAGSVRAAAAMGLVRHPQGQAQRRLLELMEDDEADVRRQCARALGAMRSGAAFAPLSVALGDDFQGVRVASARSLARLGGELVLKELENAARTWVPGSFAVLHGLEELDQDVTRIIAEWLEHPFEGVRGVAVEWVGERRLGRVEWIRELVETVAEEDPEEWVRVEAEAVLRRG